MERGLLERARGGDAAAYDAVVASHLPAVHQLARAILGPDGDADDAATCVLVAAWHELPRLEDLARFDDWLDRIVISECRMRLGSPIADGAAAPAPELADRIHDAIRARPRHRRPRGGRVAVAGLALAIPVLAGGVLLAGGFVGIGGLLDGAAGPGPASAGPAIGGVASQDPAATAPPGGPSASADGSAPPGTQATLRPGALAVVTLEGDNLRVRTTPGVADPTTKLKPQLPAGTRMLIVGGPVLGDDDREWYEIQTDGELVDLFGWVAAGEHGIDWIAPAAPRCWGELGAETMARLDRIDFLACHGRTEVKVRARAEGLWDARAPDGDCGWLRAGGVCDLDNGWLLLPAAPVTLVTDAGDEHDLLLAMPPDLSEALVKLPRQSTLLLTVSMDAPEAAACRARDAATGTPLIPDDRAVTACRLQFVVQEVAFRDPAAEPPSGAPPN